MAVMRIILLLSVLVFAMPAHAERLTVVELFTSQGCSSCPPADALLRALARTDRGLLALDWHVTYWDRLGWKDPFSLPEATRRQRDYAARMRLQTVYTPQIVVDGLHEAVGSDAAAVSRAIAAARSRPVTAPGLGMMVENAGLRLRVGAGAGDATLLVVGFDRQHATPVGAGENGGRTLLEVNVVRSQVVAARWTGAAVDMVVPLPAGERAALLLQGDDGRILAATTLP